MPSIIIPSGTKMYLTKKPPYELYIQPDKSLLNDSLYVAYDVRINGTTVIPKGTRVLGDWITESTPTLAAQLQVKKIYLNASGQTISADSDVLEAVSEYNNEEVENANYLFKTLNYRSPANITRRIVKVLCRIKVLLDYNLNSIYLEIFTKEIPVTFTSNFVARCRD